MFKTLFVTVFLLASVSFSQNRNSGYAAGKVLKNSVSEAKLTWSQDFQAQPNAQQLKAAIGCSLSGNKNYYYCSGICEIKTPKGFLRDTKIDGKSITDFMRTHMTAEKSEEYRKKSYELNVVPYLKAVELKMAILNSIQDLETCNKYAAEGKFATFISEYPQNFKTYIELEECDGAWMKQSCKNKVYDRLEKAKSEHLQNETKKICADFRKSKYHFQQSIERLVANQRIDAMAHFSSDSFWRINSEINEKDLGSFSKPGKTDAYSEVSVAIMKDAMTTSCINSTVPTKCLVKNSEKFQLVSNNNDKLPEAPEIRAQIDSLNQLKKMAASSTEFNKLDAAEKVHSLLPCLKSDGDTGTDSGNPAVETKIKTIPAQK